LAVFVFSSTPSSAEYVKGIRFAGSSVACFCSSTHSWCSSSSTYSSYSTRSLLSHRSSRSHIGRRAVPRLGLHHAAISRGHREHRLTSSIRVSAFCRQLRSPTDRGQPGRSTKHLVRGRNTREPFRTVEDRGSQRQSTQHFGRACSRRSEVPTTERRVFSKMYKVASATTMGEGEP